MNADLTNLTIHERELAETSDSTADRALPIESSSEAEFAVNEKINIVRSIDFNHPVHRMSLCPDCL